MEGGRQVFVETIQEQEEEWRMFGASLGMFAWKGWGDVQVLVHYGIATTALGTRLGIGCIGEEYKILCTKGDLEINHPYRNISFELTTDFCSEFTSIIVSGYLQPLVSY